MLPPGTRRSSPLTVVTILILLFLSSTASAASAVLGIDLGTEYIKAAIVKPGIPLDIVLTKDSRRKEAATIAFKPAISSSSDGEGFPERLYGADAVALSARFPGDVYPNLKSLLGLSYDDEIAAEYRARFPGLDMEKMQDKIGFRSQTFGKKEDPFAVEEILAMELQNIQSNAEAAAGKGFKVTDAVITIPSFFTAAEKRAVELAADLAGMNILALVSDGLAVGLNYATSRTFPSISEGAKPEYHLVYDMGAGSVTATVLKFQGRTVKEGKVNKTVQEVQVLGTAWDRTLGGDALNTLIVEDMVEKFVNTPRMKEMGVSPIHVQKHGKTMARLWKDAEKLRQVLSANTESQTSFESLFYEDMSFKYKLSRTQFEELAGTHASRVGTPLKDALEIAGLSLSDLESVILHGGAIRTPFVQKALEASASKSKLKTNVNSDEAAALGAGFRAAQISPSFRVKEIRSYDTPGFAVSYKWTSEGKERTQKLFTPSSQIGAEKQVPVKTLEDMQVDFYQSVNGQDIPVLEIKTLNLTASVTELKDKHACTTSNITTKLNVRLNPSNGLPELVQATVSCDTEATEKGTVMDGVKGLFGFGSKKDEQETLKDGDTVLDAILEDETSTSSSSSATGSSTSSSAKASATGKGSSKPTTIIIPIKFTTRPLGVSAPPAPGAMSKMEARLSSFDASDRSRRLRSEALNTLEAFTYRARDYLTDDDFIAFSSDAIRSTLEEKLNEASEWLYGDGLDASLSELKAKLKDMKTLVDPVLKRKDESSRRDSAVENLQQQLDSTKSMIRVVKDQVEKAAADAASSASEAAESASLTRTPGTASPYTTTGPSDPIADLDEDPYSTTTSTSTIPKPSPSSPISPYTEEDLSSLDKAYSTISTWLSEKVAAQSRLLPTDDPAVLVSDLEAKTKELNDELTNMLRKKIKTQPKPSYSSSSKSKKSKSKTSSAATADASGSHKKDEL